MRISHNDAIVLERIVRNVFSCDRAGMGGYIDADHFEAEPFDAALIALSPLWQRADFHEMEDFLFKWERTLRNETDEKVDIQSFIKELSNLVEVLQQR